MNAWLRRLFLAFLTVAAVAAAGIGGFLVVVNGYRYPAHGLAGVPKDRPQEALARATDLYARSSGLTLSPPADPVVRVTPHGGDTYAYGVAKGARADGSPAHVWLYLEWSRPRNQWLKNNSLVLADDDDELYYSTTWPGQGRRAAVALRKIYREQIARHLRELRLPLP